MKIVIKFQLKIVIFSAVKNRCILHGRVFVMVLLKTNVASSDTVDLSLSKYCAKIVTSAGVCQLT